ncbi:hypothetical protein CUMW_273700 [Citrus unshiu]|uniref:protein-serine/threonine phosphatase n=1 Tax=Citrus unshiu TaxID=55188 RepID=A0A2H5MWQ4_CITUN|nr:hypothetical protein CUMW_273700 [Citrus unshiu]
MNSEMVYRQKKLHLVLDLDHTLLHAVDIDILASKDREYLMKLASDGDLFKMAGELFLVKLRPYGELFLVKVRPYIRKFLKEASKMYDIYLCTTGIRSYAVMMAKLLDPKCEYHIRSRLITREDFKEKGKKSGDLVLGQEWGVVIVDDTEKVWKDHKEHLMLLGLVRIGSTWFNSVSRFSSEQKNSGGEDKVTLWKKMNSEMVYRQKKLHLVLDLDQTLPHAVDIDILASKDREYLMKQRGSSSDGDLFKMASELFLVKVRSYIQKFLKEASKMYDIYLCTTGIRSYAMMMAKLLDPKCEYHISSRLITREDFKEKGKKSGDLVLGQEWGVVIVDDTEKNPVCGDVRCFLGKIRRQILARCTLFFSRDVDDKEFEFPLLKWRAGELGAACTDVYNLSVAQVVSVSSRPGIKGRRLAEQHNKFLVHPQWIYAAYYLWSRQAEKDYFPL